MYPATGDRTRIHRQSTQPTLVMLYYTITFLIVAILAAILGFGGIAGAAASIAQILFYIFLVLLVVSLVAGLFRKGSRR